ncbi:MAG: nuclear transport factor 2 family protein, partial [Hyphomicrobiales bacterium]
MVSAATVQQLKSAYQAWNAEKAARAEPWLDLMADDVDFRSIAGGAPAMQWSRTHSSKQQVSSYFSELVRDWEMLFFQVRFLLVSGDTVAAVGECSWRHKKTRKVVHTPKLDIFR